jgi:hypothetical protein
VKESYRGKIILFLQFFIEKMYKILIFEIICEFLDKKRLSNRQPFIIVNNLKLFVVSFVTIAVFT